MKLLAAILTLTILMPSMSFAEDTLIAGDGTYYIYMRTADDGQSAVALLAKRTTGDESNVLATDEDIYRMIAANVPDQKVAQGLANQIAAQAIKAQGGADTVNAKNNASLAKSGKDYFNYMTPLMKAAYTTNGVIIP